MGEVKSFLVPEEGEAGQGTLKLPCEGGMRCQKAAQLHSSWG